MRVAIVIPVFNEAANLDVLLPEIAEVLGCAAFDHQVFVVDDGSCDGSFDVAIRHGASVLRSPRNRGKAAALQAGFDATTEYDVIVTMDGDGQDDPAEIPRLVESLKRADLVSGWKSERQDSWSKRVQSRLFTGLVRALTKIDLHDFNCGLKAYRREVIDALTIYGEQHRLIPVLAHEAGFSVGEVEVNHRPRIHGRSNYGLSRALRGPLDLVTVLFLSRFGHRPLHVFGITGTVFGVMGIGIGAYLTWVKFVMGEAIGTRPLLLLGVLLILTGLQLFAVGLLGEMILSIRERDRFADRSNGHYRATTGPMAETGHAGKEETAS